MDNIHHKSPDWNVGVHSSVNQEESWLQLNAQNPQAKGNTPQSQLSQCRKSYFIPFP